jgi:hypothetical protein
MGFAMLSMDALLIINAFVTALFIYAAYEAYQLSKTDLAGATEFRPPWAEKLVQRVTALLLLLLVAVALTLAYRYHYVA